MNRRHPRHRAVYGADRGKHVDVMRIGHTHPADHQRDRDAARQQVPGPAFKLGRLITDDNAVVRAVAPGQLPVQVLPCAGVPADDHDHRARRPGSASRPGLAQRCRGLACQVHGKPVFCHVVPPSEASFLMRWREPARGLAPRQSAHAVGSRRRRAPRLASARAPGGKGLIVPAPSRRMAGRLIRSAVDTTEGRGKAAGAAWGRSPYLCPGRLATGAKRGLAGLSRDRASGTVRVGRTGAGGTRWRRPRRVRRRRACRGCSTRARWRSWAR